MVWPSASKRSFCASTPPGYLAFSSPFAFSVRQWAFHPHRVDSLPRPRWRQNSRRNGVCKVRVVLPGEISPDRTHGEQFAIRYGPHDFVIGDGRREVHPLPAIFPDGGLVRHDLYFGHPVIPVKHCVEVFLSSFAIRSPPLETAYRIILHDAMRRFPSYAKNVRAAQNNPDECAQPMFPTTEVACVA